MFFVRSFCFLSLCWAHCVNPSICNCAAALLSALASLGQARGIACTLEKVRASASSPNQSPPPPSPPAPAAAQSQTACPRCQKNRTIHPPRRMKLFACTGCSVRHALSINSQVNTHPSVGRIPHWPYPQSVIANSPCSMGELLKTNWSCAFS